MEQPPGGGIEIHRRQGRRGVAGRLSMQPDKIVGKGQPDMRLRDAAVQIQLVEVEVEREIAVGHGADVPRKRVRVGKLPLARGAHTHLVAHVLWDMAGGQVTEKGVLLARGGKVRTELAAVEAGVPLRVGGGGQAGVDVVHVVVNNGHVARHCRRVEVLFAGIIGEGGEHVVAESAAPAVPALQDAGEHGGAQVVQTHVVLEVRDTGPGGRPRGTQPALQHL